VWCSPKPSHTCHCHCLDSKTSSSSSSETPTTIRLASSRGHLISVPSTTTIDSLFTTMTTPEDFAKQKELAAKKISDLEDHEKIFLLKREIDNLRSQLKETKSTTSSNNRGMCSSGLCRIPLLSMFLVVGVLMVTVWRKRRSVYYRYTRASSFLTDSEQVNANPTATGLQFELQEASHVYAPPSSGTIQFV
jgi:hypothetical protein